MAGGGDNIASGSFAGIGGGFQNLAAGSAAMIPGGAYNVAAGNYSFAGGYKAEAIHNGSFVWSDFDSAEPPLQSTGPNQFIIDAAGGVGIGTDSPQAELDFDDVVPVLDQDLEVSIEFFGDHDALVVIDGGICDYEIEWDLSSSLPDDIELRDCF